MLCTSCGRQWGSNNLPSLCWWCLKSLGHLDKDDNLVTEAELEEIIHPRIETTDQVADSQKGDGEVS